MKMESITGETARFCSDAEIAALMGTARAETVPALVLPAAASSGSPTEFKADPGAYVPTYIGAFATAGDIVFREAR